MQGFGVHTSMWTMQWDREGAERAVKAAVNYNMDFLEIALLDAPSVDAEHTRQLLENHEMNAVCSLGLPEAVWPSRNPEGAIDYLKVVLDTAKAMGTMAVSGVVYGGIGERSGQPPTESELSNVAGALEASAKYAKSLGLQFGIEPVNRYETHLLNTGWQAREMIERIGSDNIFIHLDTYHMNIEEKGVANGILDAREHLKYIHLSESDRGRTVLSDKTNLSRAVRFRSLAV
jgi:D-psicose/D-tagatose/L-ribulose 3-epimerase